MQDVKKNDACHPAELRHIKDLRRFREQKQIQRPVQGAKGKAAIKAGQQEICLFSAFQIPDSAQEEAQQGNNEL